MPALTPNRPTAPPVAITPQFQAEIDRLRREFFDTFGEGAAGLSTFASSRKDGEQWQTGKFWFQRKNGVTKRIKDPHASAKQPAEAPKPARPEKPEPHARPEKPVEQVGPPNSGEGTKQPAAGGKAADHGSVPAEKGPEALARAQSNYVAAKSEYVLANIAYDAAKKAGDEMGPDHPASRRVDEAVNKFVGAAHDLADAGGHPDPRSGKEIQADPGSVASSAAVAPAASAATAPKAPPSVGTRDEIRGQLGRRVTVPAGPVPANAPPSDPARRAQAANRGWNGRGHPPPPVPVASPASAAAGVNGKATSPATPSPKAVAATPAPPPPPPPPPPTPAETAHYDAMQQSDERRFGAKPAGIIRRAVEALRGFLTLGGLVGGAAAGAKIGLAAGGPLGMALGTAIGGGLGGVLGSWTPSLASAADKKLAGWDQPGRVVFTRDPATGKITPGPGAKDAGKIFTPGARTRARVRRLARKVLPKAAAAGVAVPGMVLGATQPISHAAVGSMVGGPLGAGVGIGTGVATGGTVVSGALDLGAGAAKATRWALATSAVSRRKADEKNDRRLFAEEVYPPLKNPPPRRVKWKVPVTPMPGEFHPANGVGMFDEADLGGLQKAHDSAAAGMVRATAAYHAAKKAGETMGPDHPAFRGVNRATRRYANAANALHAAGGTPTPPKLPHAPASPKFPKSMFGEGDGESLPPNAVALLKARLKVAALKSGVRLPNLPDVIVAKALQLAGEDAADGDEAQAMSDSLDAVNGGMAGTGGVSGVGGMTTGDASYAMADVGMFTPGPRRPIFRPTFTGGFRV